MTTTTHSRRKYSFVPHKKDAAVDEILFCATLPTTVKESHRSSFLRIRLFERYKTSYLSGDEWRFSAGLETRTPAGWEPLSSGGAHTIEAYCWRMFSELFGDCQEGKHPELFERAVGGIAFLHKDTAVYCASHDGNPVSLLIATGHLPWAYVLACEQGTYDHDSLKMLCAQPGCVDPWVSVYRIKAQFCRCGHEEFAETRQLREATGGPIDVRGFCRRHLRRGDCGIEDADANYEVLSGPGPNGNEPTADMIREARRIVLNPNASAPEEPTP